MDQNKFFANNEPFVNEERMKLVRDHFISTKESQFRFINFVTCFFDLRYVFSEEYKTLYLSYSEELKKMNPILFSILNSVCEKWDEEIENYDNRSFITLLFSSLENYLLSC